MKITKTQRFFSFVVIFVFSSAQMNSHEVDEQKNLKPEMTVQIEHLKSNGTIKQNEKINKIKIKKLEMKEKKQNVNKIKKVRNAKKSENAKKISKVKILETAEYFCDEPKEKKYNWFQNFFFDVLRDYSTYYGMDNLPLLGGVLLTAGVFANTNADRTIHKVWQGDGRSNCSDGFFKPFEQVGFFNYKKVYIGATILGYWAEKYYPGNLVYQWGYRSLRALFIVSPQIIFFRSILGGGRPNEKPYCKSKWRLFQKGHASCSGHTFNGALPFLTAAMMSEDPVYRYGFYFLSVLPGVARLNDGKHYFSQVFLGWSLAYLSVRAVDISDKCRDFCVDVGVSQVRDGTLLHAKYKF